MARFWPGWKPVLRHFGWRGAAIMAVPCVVWIIYFVVGSGPPSSSQVLNAAGSGPGGSAWAAGWSCTSCGATTAAFQTLILHWDGSAWSRAASPSPGKVSVLRAVSAGPGGTAWAAGWSCTSGCLTSAETDRTLILHWDGSAWSRVASPSPGRVADLYGVSAGPGGTAWAVGLSCSSHCGTPSAADRTLILHWDGSAWSRVASPSPGQAADLYGVSAGSGGTAWAAGWSCTSQCDTPSIAGRTVILRWNGSAWSPVTSPSPGRVANLYGVSTGPGATAWAVGLSCASDCAAATPPTQTLILRWNGSAWSRAASPSPGTDPTLRDVDAVGDGAWAVGSFCTSQCGTASEADQALILRWNGSAWSRTASPASGSTSLSGVTAGPGGSTWTVGWSCTANCDTTSAVDQTLVLRWNGSAWSAKS